MRSRVSRRLVHGGAVLALVSLCVFLSPRVEAANGPFNGKIAFASQRDGNSEIYTMNANGTSQVNISNNPAHDLHPSWSPDGTRIAFQSTRDGDSEIYVMNADGSNQTRLTFNSVGDSDPAWSPDGTKIVFDTDDGDRPVAGDWNGDGRDTVGVYRDSAACVFLLTNNNYSINIIATGFCGAPPVSPVTADWNGNGVDTLGVYSGSQAVFSLSNNLTGPPEFQVGFGQAGDLPVAGDWNGGNP